MNRFVRGLDRDRWQAMAAGAVLGVGVAVTVTAVTGQPITALALLGPLHLLLFLAVVQLGRRVVEIRAALRQLVPEEAQRTRQHVTRSLREYAVRGLERADAGHRRLLAAVESERLTAADRHRELLARVGQPVPAPAALPALPPGEQPGPLYAVRFLIEQQQPKLVVHLGAGVATVWLADAVERAGGRLVAVDPVDEAVAQTRALLAAHALEHVAEVRHAPLRPVTVDGRETLWYAEEAFADLHDVGLVLLRRAPGTGRPERWPPLPADRLTAGATVIVAAAATA